MTLDPPPVVSLPGSKIPVIRSVTAAPQVLSLAPFILMSSVFDPLSLMITLSEPDLDERSDAAGPTRVRARALDQLGAELTFRDPSWFPRDFLTQPAVIPRLKFVSQTRFFYSPDYRLAKWLTLSRSSVDVASLFVDAILNFGHRCTRIV